MEELAQQIEAMTPQDLKSFFTELAARFGAKAEGIYDQDPEHNGPKAQPYADVSAMLEDAAMVFDIPDGIADDTGPVTAAGSPEQASTPTANPRRRW